MKKKNLIRINNENATEKTFYTIIASLFIISAIVTVYITNWYLSLTPEKIEVIKNMLYSKLVFVEYYLFTFIIIFFVLMITIVCPVCLLLDKYNTNKNSKIIQTNN